MMKVKRIQDQILTQTLTVILKAKVKRTITNQNSIKIQAKPRNHQVNGFFFLFTLYVQCDNVRLCLRLLLIHLSWQYTSFNNVLRILQ